MTIKEFIESRKQLKSEQLVAALYKQLNIRTYLPITIKQDIVEMLCKDLLIEKDGLFTYNSINKCVHFMLITVSIYTDLKISDTKEGCLVDYDILSSTGELDAILSMIGEDFKDFAQFFELRFNDKLREQNDLVMIINNQLTGLINYITPIFDNISTQIQSVDFNTLNGVIDKYKDLN